jgi:hypothetical protein
VGRWPPGRCWCMTRVRARRPGVRGRRRRGSDQRFAVMADQDETFGLIASVPTCWRLAEIAEGRQRSQARVAAPVNAARQRAWAGIQGPPTGARRRRAAAVFPFGHERQAVRLQHPPGSARAMGAKTAVSAPAMSLKRPYRGGPASVTALFSRPPCGRRRAWTGRPPASSFPCGLYQTR